jgi:hypothetical protein
VRRLAAISLTSLAATALVTATARANAYTSVLHVYQAQGSIPPCQFTSPQLSAALKGVDAYGQQYFADYSNAVQTALAARAAGACSPGHRLSSAGPLSRSRLPASPTSATDAGLPLPILLMAALALVLFSAAALGALTRSIGWEPPWAAAWRHASAEAAYRVSGGWADLVDWWRFGR